MISKFKNNEARKSALIYLSNFEQVKELYEDDKEMAGELAISIMEMALTGEISSNNKIIRLMLKNFEVSAENNKQKYEARKRNTKQEKAEKYKLYEIAEMLNEGKTQAEIADALGISRQTVSRRLNEMIRVEYPELLCSNGKMSNDVKQCKNNDNDNDNDNDNVKEREEDRGAATPPDTTENSEIQKKQVIENSEIQKNFSEIPQRNNTYNTNNNVKDNTNNKIEKDLVSGDSKVIYISDKPIEEKQASAAKIQKQINRAANGEYDLFELLYFDVDEEELKNAKIFEEKKKALGF